MKTFKSWLYSKKYNRIRKSNFILQSGHYQHSGNRIITKNNNIKYKIDHNQQINIFDIFDLIWAPKYRSNRESEDIVVELSEIYNKLIVSDDLLELFRRSLVLWTGKFVSDKKS